MTLGGYKNGMVLTTGDFSNRQVQIDFHRSQTQLLGNAQLSLRIGSPDKNLSRDEAFPGAWLPALWNGESWRIFGNIFLHINSFRLQLGLLKVNFKELGCLSLQLSLIIPCLKPLFNLLILFISNLTQHFVQNSNFKSKL